MERGAINLRNSRTRFAKLGDRINDLPFEKFRSFWLQFSSFLHCTNLVKDWKRLGHKLKTAACLVFAEINNTIPKAQNHLFNRFDNLGDTQKIEGFVTS